MEWSRRMFVKGYVSMAEKVSGDLALKHARFALEEAQSQKKVLVDYSRERTTKALTGAIESARARELAAQAVLERERSLQKKLADQIGRCKVKAPLAGRVKYEVPISAGAVVHDGQLIFRVVAGFRGESQGGMRFDRTIGGTRMRIAIGWIRGLDQLCSSSRLPWVVQQQRLPPQEALSWVSSLPRT